MKRNTITMARVCDRCGCEDADVRQSERAAVKVWRGRDALHYHVQIHDRDYRPMPSGYYIETSVVELGEPNQVGFRSLPDVPDEPTVFTDWSERKAEDYCPACTAHISAVTAEAFRLIESAHKKVKP